MDLSKVSCKASTLMRCLHIRSVRVFSRPYIERTFREAHVRWKGGFCGFARVPTPNAGPGVAKRFSSYVTKLYPNARATSDNPLSCNFTMKALICALTRERSPRAPLSRSGHPLTCFTAFCSNLQVWHLPTAPTSPEGTEKRPVQRAPTQWYSVVGAVFGLGIVLRDLLGAS